jgi:hypothetical protein
MAVVVVIFDWLRISRVTVSVSVNHLFSDWLRISRVI